MGCQHREADAFGRQYVEGVVVHGGLGEPHALGLPAEPAPEIGDAPADFGDLVASRAERENRVVVGHRDRVAVSQPGPAGSIGG
jgi:hypothetical protein